MSWARRQFKPKQKQYKRVRVQLYGVQCADCGRDLGVTHTVAVFGERCRACWSVFFVGLGKMAGH
jgi:hypothetical protein